MRFIHRYPALSATLICLAGFAAALAQQQPSPAPAAAKQKAGPQPLPVYKLSTEEKNRLQGKVDELATAVQRLKTARASEDLLADVEIFQKAGRWLLEFPEDIFTQEDYTNALAVLDQGLSRARELSGGKSPWLGDKPRRLHGFYSELDGSVQPFGLRIPEGYDPAKPARLYVWLHGREQRLTEASFLTRFAKPAPSASNPAEIGQLQLDVYGRWNGMAYHFTGERDVFEAIAAVQKRYKIDPDRIILRGFSMGGCGAWHIALHHPDRFAAAEIGAGTWPRRSQMPGFPAYQAATLRIYENILDWALNTYNLPLGGHGGELETGTSSIPPPPPGTAARGQLESSIRVREQLAKEGFASEGDPFELHAQGTDAMFFISKGVGHSTSPEVRKKLDAMLQKYGDRGRISPDHLRFLTYTTRYNRHHWLTLDRLEKHYERAEVDAQRTNGRTEFEIRTKNLTRLVLREVEQAKRIQIDGETLAVKGAKEITLQRTAGKWKQTKSNGTGLHKVHGLQGPIDDAFLDPFLLVTPTGTPWNVAANEQAIRMLARFDRLYAKNLRAHPRIKKDTEVTPDDFAKYNVVLFGDPGSNRWIAKLQGKLPVQWTRDIVSIGGEKLPAAEHLPALVYPNPLNGRHYVILNSGLTITDQEFRGEYPMPRFGDYALLKVTSGSDIPDIAYAGLFDESWSLGK